MKQSTKSINRIEQAGSSVVPIRYVTRKHFDVYQNTSGSRKV